MADVLTPQQRSFNMSRIRNRDTRPEMIVRSIVHRMGYRYSLHKKTLPGKPDLVLVQHRKIINVHGCFFHMHDCKFGRVVPATNADFWKAKRLSNVARDQTNLSALRRNGWRVLTVWECETKNSALLLKRIQKFLASDSPRAKIADESSRITSLPDSVDQNQHLPQITPIHSAAEAQANKKHRRCDRS